MEQPGDPNSRRHTGRFAPSPTGLLHFGSLISALASYLDARNNDGRWLVRIEDVDPPREVAGSANAILRDLEVLGLHHDGPVLFQSERLGVHKAMARKLLEQGKAFWCGCTRKDLPPSGVYAGTCRNGLPPGKPGRAVRLKVSDEPVHFSDRVQGRATEVLSETTGDFIILRADGLPAYQLAVVVDDAFQNITSVVRGMDLYSSTARQIYLQRQLELPSPVYAHHPLAIQGVGQKLGKRFGSVPLSGIDARVALFSALGFLGQSPPGDLSARELLAWAVTNWNISNIPSVAEIEAPLVFQPH